MAISSTIFKKGHIVSEETRKKISLANTGKSPSLEARKKMSERQKGDRHYNWKDGISKDRSVYLKTRWTNRRVEILERLGNKCVKCDFSDKRALQIDHINGGGSKERKEFGFNSSYHKRILESLDNNENRYQLLCANCNWIKRAENNEVRVFATEE